MFFAKCTIFWVNNNYGHLLCCCWHKPSFFFKQIKHFKIFEKLMIDENYKNISTILKISNNSLLKKSLILYSDKKWEENGSKTRVWMCVHQNVGRYRDCPRVWVSFRGSFSSASSSFQSVVEKRFDTESVVTTGQTDEGVLLRPPQRRKGFR